MTTETQTHRPAKASRKQHSGITKKSYSIPISAAEHAETMAEAEGISTSALVGRAIEEMYERTLRLQEAQQIAKELLEESIEMHGPVSEEDEADIRAFFAKVDARG